MSKIISIAHLLPTAEEIQARKNRDIQAQLEIKKERKKATKKLHKSLRRAAEVSRTPTWANLRAIRKIYEDCAKKTKSTGTEYHVDHIIPLCGKYVSGLHVENNLRIIPAKENLKKYNKWESA